MLRNAGAVTLAGIVGMLSAGCNDRSTCASQYDPGNQVILESRVQRALWDISRSTFCLNVTAKYAPFFSPQENHPDAGIIARKPDDLEVSGTGTAFAFHQDDEYTYLITAAHVVAAPLIRVDEALSLQRLSSVELSLIDNQFDKNAADDISVEVLKTYVEADVAVIRTKQFLHVSTAYDTLETDKLRVGEDVSIVGFPYSMTRFIASGKIGSMEGIPHYKVKELKCSILLDAETAPGSSGSPLFVRRADRLYFVGIVQALRDYITFATGKSCLPKDIPLLGKGQVR